MLPATVPLSPLRIAHKRGWGLPERQSIPARSNCACYITIPIPRAKLVWFPSHTLVSRACTTLGFPRTASLKVRLLSLSAHICALSALFPLSHQEHLARCCALRLRVLPWYPTVLATPQNSLLQMSQALVPSRPHCFTDPRKPSHDFRRLWPLLPLKDLNKENCVARVVL